MSEEYQSTNEKILEYQNSLFEAEKELSSALRLLAEERDRFGKKEIELAQEVEGYKMEIENLHKTVGMGMDEKEFLRGVLAKAREALDMWKNVAHLDPFLHEKDMQTWERIRLTALDEIDCGMGGK